ncbi:biotin-independent malonate decarboxylase subunit beta [Nocardia sp. NPDC005825]|uniref:biotin-independent malonate decarboxylase subunit beta n=1 Tax=unclassified Nocardia TaxID=2637762 RepID=UPI00340690F0
MDRRIEHVSALTPRQRIEAVLDEGTFREILGPFDGLESPHLPLVGLVPQSDDGAVIGRGTIDGVQAVVIGIDGRFQGGGIGEVSGAKVAGGLERALSERRQGRRCHVVLFVESGGIRLQEANFGLLAISEIHAALVGLAVLGPVVAVVAGPVGCFGGMSIAVGLATHIIMTKLGRLGLNGPEVIEREAGVEELDSSDKPLIWAITGGAQRHSVALADELVDDDVEKLTAAIRETLVRPRSEGSRAVWSDPAARTLILDAAAVTEQVSPTGFRQSVARVREGEQQ